MAVNITKIIPTTPHGFPRCLSQQRLSAEPPETIWSPWDECPTTHVWPWGKLSLLTSQCRDIQQELEPLFLALPFLVSYDGRSERLPWVGKGEQSHCHLAVAPRKGHCPQGQDLLLPPSRPSELNPSCFLVYPLASQGNINKFADIRTSWPHLFSCAKFSLSAMCPGHACQRAVASAGPSPSLKGLHDS